MPAREFAAKNAWAVRDNDVQSARTVMRPLSRAVRRSLRCACVRTARASLLAAGLTTLATASAVGVGPSDHARPSGDGTVGFVLRGIDAGDFSGWAVSDAGDVNGDGIDDLIVGALGSDANGDTDAGESYVVFGRTTGFPAAFELSGLLPQFGGDGSTGFVLNGIDPGTCRAAPSATRAI
jgi:hypothetical protein